MTPAAADADAQLRSGRCACGAVRYEVRGPLRDVYNCHCPRCRRITGHYLAATAAHPNQVTVLGSDQVRWWAPDETVEYGFCGTCGSTLFWRAKALPDKLSIAAGTLDPPTGLRTTKAWWCAQASDYHRHPEGLALIDYEG
jgi:hypothetical protein